MTREEGPAKGTPQPCSCGRNARVIPAPISATALAVADDCAPVHAGGLLVSELAFSRRVLKMAGSGGGGGERAGLASVRTPKCVTVPPSPGPCFGAVGKDFQVARRFTSSRGAGDIVDFCHGSA